MIEKNLGQINQSFPAYANEPLLEKYPLNYIKFGTDGQACHRRHTPGITVYLTNIFKPATMSLSRAVLPVKKANYKSNTYVSKYIIIQRSKHETLTTC
ncbi:MAG: hypothetical protein PHY24_04710 [Candidatus Cloacimonetes bacterium]|nr:hypothetical protein [Candidatus Cloacimonadota bacterium]